MTLIIKMIIFLAYYSIFILMPGILQMKNLAGVITFNFNQSSILMAMMINSLPMLFVGYLLSLDKDKKIVEKKTVPLWVVLTIPILICLIIFGINALMSLIYALVTQGAELTRNVIAPNPRLYGLTALTCVVIGYSEETFFRRAARSVFATKNLWISYGITSVLFGAAHINQGLIAVIFSTIAGMVFAVFYERLTHRYANSGWHITSMGHALYNFVMILLAK